MRTHTCGELREKDIRKKVILCGWIHSFRTHGGVLFADIRDRYGVTQCVFKNSPKINKDDVVKVEGKVKKRLSVNNKLLTGKIEIDVSNLEFLNKCSPLPLDENAEEDTRLKFRYVDLRSEKMQNNICLRHNITTAVRKYFDKKNFLEIETPILAKSTPEGARDYIVPSRVHAGKFYALPQSPQIYKQLTMLGGMDRYFQIVKCFRDEDLRADRQPEFTQIDVEMSFVDQDDVFNMMEGLMVDIMQTIGVKIKTPFKKIAYADVMSKYGTDKPDLRFGMELNDVTSICKKTAFNVFKNANYVGCIVVLGGEILSKKEIDKLTEIAKIYDAKGIAPLKIGEKIGVGKYFEMKDEKELCKLTKAKKGDLVIFVADNKHHVAQVALGAIRNYLAKKMNLIKDSWEFCWIAEFPMFEFDEEEQRHTAMHHPFTSPKEQTVSYLSGDPHKLLSKGYDLVLNGVELGGGSIRIHRSDVQSRVFELMGIGKKEAEDKFGFLVNAFKYGAPPHGGIAFGLDRICAMLSGEDNIREVIAFPKTKSAEALMEGAPSEISSVQMDEAHIKLK